MLSENLKITGKMKINGVNVPNIDVISNQIAYVMQDDVLLGTFTPRGFIFIKIPSFLFYYCILHKEAFYFAASMRLAVSKEEKWNKVIKLQEIKFIF